MTKQLFNRLLKDTKQALTDIDNNETYNYIRFNNNGTACYILATSGGYSLIYDDTNDRMIVAWLVRLFGHEFSDNGTTLFNKGDWGQGYYFNNEGGNDLVTRYELNDVIDLFIKKALS